MIKRIDVEVILVNNGSKDNSQLVLNECISKVSLCSHSSCGGQSGIRIWNSLRTKRSEGRLHRLDTRRHADSPYDPIKALDLIESAEILRIYLSKEIERVDLSLIISLQLECLFLRAFTWE